MSVTIPPHFPDWLTRWVIGHFPVGSPKDIRAAADAWARSAERLKVTLQHLERLADDVSAAIQGEAADAIQKQLKTEIANTRNQIEFADGMATLLYDSANSIELEQYIVIGIGAVLLANLLIDTTVPMKAASDRVAAEVAATTARRDTLAFLFQRAAAFMERFPHMALAIRATIMGSVSMGGVVAGAQYAQIIQGHGKPGRRTSIDWGQVWVAAAAGGAGGLVGSLATRAVLPALTRIGANAATQAGRSTGRAVAVVLASATGGAAGGAAGAVTMSAITHAKLNLAQMIMMGASSGAVGGFGAAMRATRAMGAPIRPREETFTETGRSRSDASPDGLPVREAPDWAWPHSNADTPRSHEKTSPEIDGPRDDSSRDGLPSRTAPEEGDQHTIRDGHTHRPPKDTIDEINKDEIDKFDESYAEAFRKLDEGGAPPPSDPPQSPGTPQAPPASPTSPGTSPAPGHGWSPWDDALKLLNEGGFEAAPADPMATPGSSSPTGLGTAQFQSSRPDSPQMGLAGNIVAAEGQPSATPGSVMTMTMSANTHAENNTHFGTAKDLGGTGNGPGVTAGPPVAHGGSPTGGGPGPHSNTAGHGPGELPPSPDEASILHLDFDYEPVANEPATPAGTSPAATPHVASATPVEPVPGSGPGSTPSASSAETKSPTTPVGASAGPGGTPATPAPTPAANASQAAPQANPPQQPHANPQAAQPNAPQPQAAQANPPQPHATPQGAQANSPQQPQAATPSPGAAANNSASQAIPLAPLAGAAALSGHGPSNPDSVTGLSAPPPAMSGGQPTDNDQTTSDPEEFPDRIGTIVTPPMPSYVPAQPQVDEFPNKEVDEYTKPPGTTYKIPGQPDPPDGPPPNAIPIVLHPTTPALPDTGPAIPLTDRPQVPIPDTAVPGAPAENDQDEQKPRVHDSEPPLPRHNNTPAPHLPATPADRPTELNPPSHYATTPNPQTPGAPTDPTATPQNHDSTQYIPDPTVQPTRGGTPATTLAGPLPQPVVPARPVPMASASANDPKKRKRKQETPPESPAPVPTTPPQPKPKKRPGKGQPPPQPAAEPPPTPTSGPPTPAAAPKPRKRSSSSTPPIRELFIVRQDGEDTGVVGEEGPRVRPAGRARAWVRSLPQKFPWLTEDLVDTAELLVSETVANSLRWTKHEVAVILTVTDTDDVRQVRFTVTDKSSVVPESTDMPDWDAECGRGGPLVDMLSADHGTIVQDNGTGKSTWFELHQPHGGPSDLGIPSAAPDNDDSGSDAASPPSPPEPTPTPFETNSAATEDLPAPDRGLSTPPPASNTANPIVPEHEPDGSPTSSRKPGPRPTLPAATPFGERHAEQAVKRRRRRRDNNPGTALPVEKTAEIVDALANADWLLAPIRKAVRDNQNAMADSIGTLPETQRATLYYRFVQGLSAEATAETLGRTIGATKALQSRALQTISEVLPGDQAALLRPPMGRRRAATSVPPTPAQPNPELIAPEPADPVTAIDNEIRDLEHALGIETDAERMLEIALYQEGIFWRTAIAAEQVRPELLFGQTEWLSWLDARKYAQKHLDDELTVDFILELHRRLGSRIQPDDTGKFHIAKNKHWGVLSRPLTESERGDFHGRLTRVLLYWALEKAGVPPSAIPDFDEDLYGSAADWTETIRAGSMQYRLLKGGLAQLGRTVPPVILANLEYARDRYRQMNGRRSPFVPGELHDGVACKRLLAILEGAGPLPDDSELVHAIIDKPLRAEDATPSRDAPLKHHPITNGDPPPSVIGNRVATDGADISKASPRNPSEQSATPWGGRGSSDTPVASPGAPRARGAMPFDPVLMAGNNGTDVEIDHAVARRRNGRNDGAWAVFNRFGVDNAGQHDGRKRRDKGVAAEAAPTPWNHRRSAEKNKTPMKSDFQRTPGTDKVAAPDSALEPENHTTPDTNNSNTQQGSPRPAAESIPEPDAIGSNTHAHSPKPTTESSAQGNSPHTAHKSDSRTQAGPALAPGSPIGAARAPQSGNPKQSKTVQQAKESPAAAAPGSPEPGVPGAPGHGALSPEQSQQGPGAAPQPDPYKWDPGRDWVATEHVSVLGVVHAFEQLNPATKVSFQPGVDLRRAQEALQTIHDHLTKHPMVVIRELALTSFEDGRIYDGFPHVSDGQVVTGRLQLDVDYVIREKEKEDRSLTIEEVWQCATEMFADALMFATCWRAEAQAETALRKTHERRAATESPVDFDKWLQTQFTKACFFNKKSLRDLDIRQAFRQSFAAKEYWFNPSPGEYALYSLLTTLARQLHGMTLPPERVLTAAELASMEEGAEIARGLEHDLGVKAVGLAGPDLDLDALRQFAQAMRELLTKNPGLLAPDPEHHRPVIGVDMPSRYTTMIWTRSQEIDGRRQVTGFWLSERYAMSLSLFQQDVQRSVDSQWLSADSEQAFKSIAFHEEGHWFHNLSGLKYIPEADYQNIMSALVALFVRTSLSTTMDTFPAWLRRELSGYSFQRRETKHKASETPKEQEGADAVALRELYAEANMAVNMHGSRATDAQKLVHSHLMAAYERQKQSEHDAGGVRSEGGEDGLTAAPHKPSERSVTPWSGAGSVNAENRPADRHSATDGDVRATQQAGRDAGGTASAPTDGQSKPGRAGDTPVASPAAPRGRGAMPFDPVQMAGDNGRDVEIDHAVARRRNGRNAGAWAVFNRFAGENAGQHDGRKRPDKGAAAEAAPTPWSRRSADTAAVPARPQTVQVLSQTPDDLEMQIRWQRALRDDAATERGLDPAMLTPNSLALEWLRIRAEAARDELAESLGVDRGELYPRLVRHALDELQAGLNYLHDEGWLRVSRERPATEVMAWIGRFVRQIAAEQEATTQQQKNHLKLIRDELHSNLHEILGTRWELGRASIFAIDWKFDIGKVNDKRELLLGQSWRPFENNPMGNLRRYGHVAGIPEILHLADAVECFEAATLVQHADEFNRLSAMAEAGTGMSRTVARFDSSTRQEFVAPVPMRDEFLRNFPRIPVEQAFSSIADIGRSFSLDPYGLRLTAQAYDVASEFIAPFHKWVGESMLHRLRPRAAENPLWRCMFAARDGHIIAAAIRNIDPVFFAKFCREVGYSSKVIEMVARDFERLTGKKLPLPKTFRSGLSEEAEALVSGTYRNFVKHMRSEGIDLELPGSAYTIVDDALRGRMEEVVKHVFTEPEITGEYTILTIHPDDPHPNSKRGHLFHLPASHWQGGSGLTRYVPAEERLTFLANPAVWIFEELGQGPAHTVETITENGPDQRRAPKTRFSRDRFPPDLDEMAREPRVVQAMKTAVLLATAHYARDGGQGDVRPFLRQSRSWVLQDGNTDPRFFALASALVPRFQGVQEGWLVPDARPTRPKLPTGGNAGETFAPTRTRKAAP